MSRLIDLIAQRASETPNDIAFVSRGTSIPYLALPFQIAGMAARINAADPSGRPVGIHLPNSLEWILADLALAQLGRVGVPLPPFFLPGQVEAALADAGASSVIDAGSFRLIGVTARK